MPEEPRVTSRPASTWTVAAVGLILAATLPPQPRWQGAEESLLRSLSVPRTPGGWWDVAQNLVLFAPMAFVLAAHRWPVWRITFASLAGSLVIELLQTHIPGRNASLRDVCVNAAGAYAIGRVFSDRLAGAARRTLDRFERFLAGSVSDRSHASWLALGAGTAAAVVILLTGALLHVAPAPAGLSVVAREMDGAPRGGLRIGHGGTDGSAFRGVIDDVRVFRESRTADQIRADMRAPGVRAEQPQLVVAYTFDRPPNPTVRDDSGHGLEGVGRNVRWTPGGRNGGALEFRGGDSEVLVPFAPALDLRDAVTLEAWVYPLADQPAEPVIVARDRSIYYLELSSSFGPFHVAGGGRFGAVPRYAMLRSPIARTEWTHLAFTFDGQILRLYVNGELAARRVHWSPHRLERAVLNGSALPRGPVQAQDAVAALLTAPARLELELRCGEPSKTAAPAFLIEGLRSTPALELDARGSDILVKPWTWARKLGLASPPSVVHDALDECLPGQSRRFTISGPFHHAAASVNDSAARVSTPGIGAGWSLLFHAEFGPGWMQRPATVVWIALITVPVGLWVRKTATALIGLGLMIAACLATPRIYSLRALNGFEWAGLTVGLIAGLSWQLLRVRPVEAQDSRPSPRDARTTPRGE